MITMFKGIDISEFQTNVNYAALKNDVDFVMIRAGYGKNNIDACAFQHIRGCKENGIPFGLFWFSYAYTPEMSRKEADYLCDIADDFAPDYPLAFDYEYASDDYAKRCGYNLTNSERQEIAKAFLYRVEERGYYAMNYTNPDYMTKGFSGLTARFDTWLAEWDVSEPSYNCGIWQNTNSKRVDGISGSVDGDIAYKNYIALCSGEEDVPACVLTETDKERILSILADDFWKAYIKLANDIIDGKYGNGDVRKKNIEALGYDYSIAQTIVNYILGVKG